MSVKNKVLLAAAGLVITASGQDVSVGIVGGISPGDDYRSNILPRYMEGPVHRTTGYPIGLSVEFSLRSYLSLEVDGLYRAQHFTDGPSSVVTWQVPVLAKCRFTLGSIKPFVEAGPSFRAAGNLNGTDPSHYGGTAGVGLTLRAGGFKIEPAVRYTHWARERPNYDERAVPNRVEFLVGVSTGGGSGSWRPFGHRVSVGGIAGATLTKDFRGSTFEVIAVGGALSSGVNGSGPQSYIAGAMLEVEVKSGLSIEADGIYRPLQHSSYLTALPVGLLYPATYLKPQIERIVTWEFPILAKYKFGTRWVKPLVELGPSFRTPVHSFGPALSPFGITAGAGVEAKWGGVKIAPVVRYAHWGRDSSNGSGDVRRNEAVALVGISF